MNLGQGRKRIATALILLISSIPSRAAWEVKSSRELPVVSDAIRHVELRVAGDREATVNAVFFDAKNAALAVVDDPAGENDLAQAMEKRHALAGINGGYFHPDRTPLGLLRSAGKTIHAMERAKLLSGFLVVRGSRASLLRVAEFSPKIPASEALQAGPFLVDRGKPVAGLNATRSARRTVLVADANGVRALAVISAVTLAEAGQILATPRLFGTAVQRALNLDGGSSTALWVRTKNEPFSLREFKSVRNYVAIVPR